MLRALIATGWRRLALVLLALWEVYWLIEWRSAYAEAERLAREAYYTPIYPTSNSEFDAAYAASEKAVAILIASPIIALLMFIAGKWVGAGFRTKRN